ncbi:hypothetical protein GUJ93_ZPchr0004g40480 [Zizania palustris]|uniref:SANTA domain-containing protein n=1 Tax=Zizania palustris TaxID=103762 RepID=A0A8J5SXS6_ZIZPA|nr:hypothetical protein GUJ93_ZPchr0004g40480 [Zizania palustris]
MLLLLHFLLKDNECMQVCEKFMNGFPCFWENYNMLYPKTDNSCIGSIQDSSNAINSREGSTKFYLEKFELGNVIDSVGSSFIMNLLNNSKISPGGDETSKEAVNQNDIVHPNTIEQEPNSHLVSSDLMYNRSTENMPCDTENGNANAGHSVGQGSKEFLAIVPLESVNWSCEIAGCSDNILPTSMSKSKGCPEIAEHITLNEEVAPHDDMSTSVHSDVQSLGNLIVPEKEQRSEHDVLLGAIRSPMIRTPRPHVSGNKFATPSHRHVRSPGSLTCGPLIDTRREWHIVKFKATRSANPSVHCSRTTRAKSKSLSVSTPESLKLRRTRSGRVVVPRLDPSCQRIVYDREGSVSGVVGLEFESALKGRKSGTSARKKKAR